MRVCSDSIYVALYGMRYFLKKEGLKIDDIAVLAQKTVKRLLVGATYAYPNYPPQFIESIVVGIREYSCSIWVYLKDGTVFIAGGELPSIDLGDNYASNQP